MTVLEQFIVDLQGAIKDYETSRPFGAEVRANRAQDVSQLNVAFVNATSAVALRQEVLKNIDGLKVGSFSFMAALDLHALRVRINKVTDKEEYSITNLLMSEHTEIRKENALYRQQNEELRHKATHSPEEFKELKKDFASLNQTVQNQTYSMEILTDKQSELLSQLGEVRKECNTYKEALIASKQECADLRNTNMELLQANKQLADKNTQIEDKNTQLEAEMAALKQTAQPKQEERKKAWGWRFGS